MSDLREQFYNFCRAHDKCAECDLEDKEHCHFDWAYQQGATDMEKAKQIIIDSLLKQIEQIRADVIDEFANALINDGKVSAMRVLKIKEQLKENKNEMC